MCAVGWSGGPNGGGQRQPIEVFENQKAFDAHVSAAHTIQFRRDIHQYIGAPYDERLYRFTNHSVPIEP